jgi:ElaB/YqjD/DUF883 family membrane-anchored ribosome-binding protein
MSISNHSVDKVQAGISESVNQMLGDARDASEQAVHYIESEPVKSVLMAAGVGATVAVILTLMLRPHSR